MDTTSLTIDLDDPAAWDALLQDVDSPSLLAIIASRMGERMRLTTRPEDVLQDTLLTAWQLRHRLEWRGLRAFRGWLITIAEHRLSDIVKQEITLKRGGDHVSLRFSDLAENGDPSRWTAFLGKAHGATTPCSLLVRRERSIAIQEALEALPLDQRAVVRLRLIEGRTTAEVAELLGLGQSAVKHRLRAGARTYRARLRAFLDLSCGSTALPAPESGASAG